MSTPTPEVAAPPARFNFAEHLLQANAGRPAKAAFVDEAGTLSYGELQQRVRRVAAGLRGLGLRREERVLLLMQDCSDWPVSFLGAIYAGLVPVAVNTLLTADDYAYMLENSRAQAVLVSGALLPTLTAAMTRRLVVFMFSNSISTRASRAAKYGSSASGRPWYWVWRSTRVRSPRRFTFQTWMLGSRVPKSYCCERVWRRAR